MPRRGRRARDPDLLVVDADVLFDDVWNRKPGARGLIEALAEACYRFAFDAKLKGEYRQFDGRMPMSGNVVLVRAKLYSKAVPRARHPLPALPSRGLGTWDRPDDDHLLQTAVKKNAGRVLTSEKCNLDAAADVRAQLDVEVVGIDDARVLADRDCPRSRRRPARM